MGCGAAGLQLALRYGMGGWGVVPICTLAPFASVHSNDLTFLTKDWSEFVYQTDYMNIIQQRKWKGEMAKNDSINANHQSVAKVNKLWDLPPLQEFYIYVVFMSSI